MNLLNYAYLMCLWHRKMESGIAEKCLAFCQALTSSNHKFSLSLSIGQDNFNFCNKDLVKIPVFKKKSPSQMRREAKRKLEREQKNQSEDTESD